MDGSSDEKDSTKLNDVLRDKEASLFFKAFLDKVFCTENLYFWMEIESYKKISDQKEVQARANELYVKYFDPESLYELNVPSSITDELALEMKKQSATSVLFNHAQSNVYHTMELDSFPRFKQSVFFREWVDACKKQQEEKADHNDNVGSLDEMFTRMSTTFHQMTIKSGSKNYKFSSPSTLHLQQLIKKHTSEEPVTVKKVKKVDDQADKGISFDILWDNTIFRCRQEKRQERQERKR